jgi:hypothetical protein
MKIRFLALPVVLSLVACRVENSLPRNSCETIADCLNGFTCQEKVCVPADGGSGGGGSGCETFPPAACAQPLGMSHRIDRSELERLLPGRWLWCTGSMSSGMPVKFGRQDGVGFEFNADATLWWVLVDGGNGFPVRATGFDAGGTVEFLGDLSTLQINMIISGNHWIGVVPELTDGPPLHMRFMFSGAMADYVHDETQCGLSSGTDMGGGSSDLASSGTFGGTCDPNVVLPTSCPAVGGVACSVCGYANMAWQCLQPCHVGSTDCTSPQHCVALGAYTLAGDCVGYDGYCS